MIQHSGSTYLTADGAVGKSGSPTRVFTAIATAAAGGAGELVLRNGTSASGTVYFVKDGSDASHSDIFDFGPEGVVFPDGCFFDKDANTASVVIQFRNEAL